MSTTLKVMAYNTHLFGTFAGIISRITGSDVYWQDKPTRFDALKACIKNASICGADIISIEEMWSSDLVEAITSDSVSGLYPNSCYSLHDGRADTASNPSGLLLLGNSRVDFNQNTFEYFNYIDKVGRSSFGSQDQHDSKGYLKVLATVDKSQSLWVMNTHMPVQSSSYPGAVGKCFEYLAAAAAGTTPTLLLGDFNLSEADDAPLPGPGPYAGLKRFSEWVGPDGYLGKDGKLVDVYRTLYPSTATDPGYSVIGNTNTCWRHFNESKVGAGKYDFSRIDYVMCRGLTPQSMSVMGKFIGTSGTDYSDAGNDWVWTDSADNPPTRDLSDHYPVIATLSF